MTLKERNAYAAGLLDGEGYLGLIPRYQKEFEFVPVIKVASTTYELLDFLYEEFGGHMDKERQSKQANRKPSKMWTLKNRKAITEFLFRVYPYLKVKKRQADIIKEFITKAGTWRQTSTMTPEERKTLYLNLRKLNHRGLATTE